MVSPLSSVSATCVGSVVNALASRASSGAGAAVDVTVPQVDVTAAVTVPVDAAPVTVTAVGPSGTFGTDTLICGFVTPSAKSRFMTATPGTDIVVPPLANVTLYDWPGTMPLGKTVTVSPGDPKAGRIGASGGGGLLHPQPASTGTAESVFKR